jgi:hypothetical protein
MVYNLFLEDFVVVLSHFFLECRLVEGLVFKNIHREIMEFIG